MSEPKSIRALLDATRAWFEKRKIESARLDAELLLAHVLDESRLNLYLDLDRPLGDVEVNAYRELVRRRGTFEPIAYILGEQEFYGRPFKVAPAVLIPRPDTESVVEACLDYLDDDEQGVVVDVGTGSGCIAITLACERPGVVVVATDISVEALKIAKENAEKNGVRDRVHFVHADLFSKCQTDENGQEWSSDDVPNADVALIVSNPPYISAPQMNELMRDVRDHEPHLALAGDGEDGFDIYARLLAGAHSRLAPDAALVFEMGFDQAKLMRALSPPGDLSRAFIREDLAQNDRIAIFLKPNATNREHDATVGAEPLVEPVVHAIVEPEIEVATPVLEVGPEGIWQSEGDEV